MKTLYYDCFAGISGDMNLGALIDLGADPVELEHELGKLGLHGWRLECKKDSRLGIFGTKASVVLEGEENACTHADLDAPEHREATHTQACEHAVSSGEHAHVHSHDHSHNPAHVHSHAHSHAPEHGHHRHRPYAEIKKLIKQSRLNEKVKSTSLKIFDILANAEARVHGKSADEVCFHEVGAVDSIIDIVGAAICLDKLGIQAVHSSPVELGGGRVMCAHGLMPVPAPATAILAEKFESTTGAANHECTTPTGAAIIAALATPAPKRTAARTLACGVGIGQRDCPELPNVLRVRMAEVETPALQDGGFSSENRTENADGKSAENESELITQTLCELHANIDDATAECVAYATNKLLSMGALDTWQESIVMKKNRIATKLCVLCEREKSNELTTAIFENTPSLGVRKFYVERKSLPRRTVCVETKYGKVRIKIRNLNGAEKFKPEFDDCATLAVQCGKTLDEISKEAEYEFKKTLENKKDS